MTDKGRIMIVAWVLAAFAGVFTCNSAQAGNEQQIANVGGTKVYRVDDGRTTCYVAVRPQIGYGDATSISCVFK